MIQGIKADKNKPESLTSQRHNGTLMQQTIRIADDQHSRLPPSMCEDQLSPVASAATSKTGSLVTDAPGAIFAVRGTPESPGDWPQSRPRHPPDRTASASFPLRLVTAIAHPHRDSQQPSFVVGRKPGTSSTPSTVKHIWSSTAPALSLRCAASDAAKRRSVLPCTPPRLRRSTRLRAALLRLPCASETAVPTTPIAVQPAIANSKSSRKFIPWPHSR